MGIDSDVNKIFKRMSEVHPKLFGHHAQDYMKEYLKTAILIYEQIQHEKLMERQRVPYTPLSWQND